MVRRRIQRNLADTSRYGRRLNLSPCVVVSQCVAQYLDGSMAVGSKVLGHRTALLDLTLVSC